MPDVVIETHVDHELLEAAWAIQRELLMAFGHHFDGVAIRPLEATPEDPAPDDAGSAADAATEDGTFRVLVGDDLVYDRASHEEPDLAAIRQAVNDLINRQAKDPDLDRMGPGGGFVHFEP